MAVEGQTAIGPNGERAVFRGGQWVVMPQQPQMPADPSFPFEGPKAAADAQRAQAGATVEAATVDSQIALANAQARAAEAEARVAEMEAARGPQPTATQAEQEAKQTSRERKAAVVRSIMGDVLEKYQQSLRGQPLSRMFGSTEYIDAIPANEAFTKGAMGMLGLIRPMVAMGAKEGDSDKEMEAFLAYIPSADDSDRTIETKLRNLERLITGVVDGKLPSQIIAGGGLSSDNDTPLVDAVLGGGSPPPSRSGGDMPRQMIPGTGGTGSAELTGGETYSTPEDVAVANEINAVYRAGGGIQDMIAVARKYNRPVDVRQASQWQSAIDYRDGTGEYEGRPGGFSPVNTPESGRRNFIEQAAGNFMATPFGTGLAGAANAFTGGGIDEIGGAAYTALNGGDLGANIAYGDLAKQALAEENPGAYLTGNLIGGGLQAGAGLTIAPGALKAATATLPRILGSGAAYGAGTGAMEANEDRLGGALGGAAIGLGGGLAGRYVLGPTASAVMGTRPGQALSSAARGGFNRAAGLFGSPRRLPPQNLPQMSASEIAMERALGGGLDTSAADMTDAARLGVPMVVADLTRGTRTLGGSVARYAPAESAEAIEQTLMRRQEGQSGRAVEATRANLSDFPEDVRSAQVELRDRGGSLAEPFYRSAYNQPAPFDRGVADELSTPAGRKAIGFAAQIAGNNKRPLTELGFVFDEKTGEFTLPALLTENALGPTARRVPLPTWETLHYVRQGLDRVIRDAEERALGTGKRVGPDIAAITGVRNRLDERIRALNPSFKQGDAIFAAHARQADALGQGYSLFPNPKVPPARISSAVEGFTPQELAQARSGFAANLAGTASNLRGTADVWRRIYGSDTDAAKVGALFPEGAADFGRTADLEGRGLATFNEALRGSQTQARNVADQGFSNPLTDAAVDAGMAYATGGASVPLTLARFAAPGLRDKLRLGFSEKKAKELAPLLFNPDPSANLELLQSIKPRIGELNARKNAFRQRGGLFGVTIPVGAALAYQ